MIRKLNGETRTLATDIKASMQADITRLFETQQGYDDKLSDAVERRFKRERLRHGQQAPETDALAQDGGANLKRILIMKADKVDLEKLYEIKSNKVDTDNMLDIQSMMQKQFKHILVLFIELINIQHLKADDTRGSFEKRQQDLICQV